MREPVKECVLCGALVRQSMAAKHVDWHRRAVAIKPERIPPVLEEPSRRPAPLAALPHRAIPTTLPRRR